MVDAGVFARPLSGTPVAFRVLFWTMITLVALGTAGLFLFGTPDRGPTVISSPGFLAIVGLILLADLYPLAPWLREVRAERTFLWSTALILAAVLAYGPWAAPLFAFTGLLATVRRPGSRWWRMVVNASMFTVQGFLTAGLYVCLYQLLGVRDGRTSNLAAPTPWQLIVMGVVLAAVQLLLNSVFLSLATIAIGASTMRRERRVFLTRVPLAAISLLFAPLCAQLALSAPELLPLLGFGIFGVHQVQSTINRSIRKARSDPLTGLANRAALLERLAELLETGDQGGVRVLVIDLNGFKLVNDTYGHPVGDELLVSVGRRLVAVVEPSALVARYGGDKFAIVLPPRPTGYDVEHLVVLLISAVSRPVLVGPHSISVSASVGVATSQDSPTTPMELIGQADRAMYLSKPTPARTPDSGGPDGLRPDSGHEIVNEH